MNLIELPRQRLAALVVSLLLLSVGGLQAAVCQDLVVDLGATISTNPVQIKLDWALRLGSTITSQTLYRRLKGATSWSTVSTMATNTTTFTDTNIAALVEYEYWLHRGYSADPYAADGYLNAGINVPFVENRGKLILIVDASMTNALAPELAQLQQDLTGDGWTVLRHDVPRMSVDPANTNSSVWAARSNELTAVKSLIVADYNADSNNVKAVYLFGRTPVPYSGNIAPDGHPDHYGAWGANAFYGDMNGNWTDSSLVATNGSDKRGWNVPGDGKFDQSSIPSDVELQVGRVDLANMTKFPTSAVTETDLLRRYLRKAHQYRQREGALADVPRRAMVRDGFGFYYGEGFATTAWGAIYSCLGRTNTTWDAIASDSWFIRSATNTYLFGYGCGGGNYEGASSVGSSTDFGSKTSRVVFTSIFGSYFGDWDRANDFLRAPLAGNARGNSYGLTCFWSGRPGWFLHHMGMGETVGYAASASQNNNYGGYQPVWSGTRQIHIGLMGDPSLRFYPVLPPQNLVVASASGAVALDWDTSTETNLLGYHVFRADTPTGPFTRLTATELATPGYTDTSVTVGSNYTYMVRTLKLETVPGGTFQNFSQAAFATITASAAATSVPWNPTNLQITPAASTQIILNWQDNSTDETGFRIERRDGPGSNFVGIGSVSANATNFTDNGPLPGGTIYYYRVIATGNDGDSVPSNEVYADGAAGFIELPASILHVDKSVTNAVIPVARFGGSNGAVGVTCYTANSSAIAGTHYTSFSNTVTFADGDATQQTVSVPLLNTGSPQLPRSFKVTGKTPTGGANLASATDTLVLIEDSTATLDAPWQRTILGTPTDYGPAVSAESVIGSSIYGGAISTGDDLRFIYQIFTNDVVLTAKLEAPLSAQNAARYGLMMRTNLVRTGPMVLLWLPGDSSGAKLGNRTNDSGNVTYLPSISNSNKAPYWLRLTRLGNVFTGETSSNGVDWAVLASTTQTAPTACYWGLFHYSDPNTRDFQLARFSNVTIAVPSTPPTTPTNLTAIVGGVNVINLTWAAAQFASQIRIERSLDSGAFVLLTNLTGTATACGDTNLVGAGSYAYRVRAESIVGTSDWSNVATVFPAPVLTLIAKTLSGGNGDGKINPNECNLLTCVVTNSGVATATAVTATLSTTNAGLTVLRPVSAYPDLSPGSTGTNLVTFLVDSSSAMSCGAPVTFQLILNYTGGAATNIFTVPAGTGNYLLTPSTGASIVPGTTDIGNHSDDLVTTIALPFNYTFYGQTYSNVTASSNGNLQFGSASTAYSNTSLPASGFLATIFAYWADLDTGATGKGIYTSVTGSAPNRIFNIEWRTKPLSVDTNLSFEIRLYEGQQRFDIIYGEVYENGSAVTVGVQSDAAVYTQFSYDTPSLTNGMQLTYIYSPTCPSGPARCDTDANGLPDWWTMQYFGHATSLPGDQSGPFDDPAGDGIPNLMKYALGIDPFGSGYQGHLATGTTNITDQTYLVLTYTRPEPAPPNITYAVEVANDLAVTDWTSAETVEVSNTVTGAWRTITIRDQYPVADRPKRFIHLRVTQP